MKRDIAKDLYKFYRSGFKKLKNSDQSNENRERNTDPQSIQSILSEVISNRNWSQGVAEGSLFSDWKMIVGDEIAEHTTPISLVDGKLTIQSLAIGFAGEPGKKRPESSIRDLGGYWCRLKITQQLNLKKSTKVMTHQTLQF